MMRSLFSGVSGLKVHQTKMDVLGNNIANVNTIGFKSSSVSFTDIFYQTTQSASGPNAATGAGGTNAKQIGLGSTLGTVSVNITGQGGAQRTDNPFDLMINGGSFFIVNKGGENFFTRAGNFTTDQAGTLVTGSGNTVMGWQADKNGSIIKERVSALKIMSEDKQTTPPEATTAMTIYGNIKQGDSVFNKENPDDQYYPIAVSFFDALGYEYKANFRVTENKAGTPPVADGTYTLVLHNITLDGKEVVDSTACANLIDGAAGGAKLEFNKTGATDTTTGIEPGHLMAPTGDLTLNLAGVAGLEAAQDITLNISQLTNFGSASTADGTRGDMEGRDKGKAVGKMSEIGIQQDGIIVASYSNGDRVILGQIAVATFPNPAGLEKVGDNLYTATLNSGEFNGIGEDITASGGKFSQGVVEMSNVDLSTEFTEMITTQRGFQANSRIITTSDSMLEELLSLKR